MEEILYHVFCVKDNARTYKLQIFIEPHALGMGINIPKLMGLWDGHCKADNISIKKIELFLPPQAEKLYIENNLRAEILKEFDVEITINIGLRISSDISYKEDTRGNNKRILMLAEKDTDLN